MALGFFRRNQKLVFWIMVALMVAFLVPVGIQGIFTARGGAEEIGTAGSEKLGGNDLRAADAELTILRRMGLGRQRGADVLSLFMQASSGQPLHWALLVHEAKTLGFKAPESQVDSFFREFWKDDKTYQREIANLNQAGFYEKLVRRAAADYLLVHNAFTANSSLAPLSVEEMRRIFRDLYERIDLNMAAFDAKDLEASASEPTEQQVKDWFLRHRDLAAGDPDNRTEFGMGYRQPDMVNLAWLFIDRDLIQQVVEPSETEMTRFWDRQGRKITATAPASRPTTGPTTASAADDKDEYQTITITRYSEAKEEIRRQLKPQVANQVVTALLERARELIAKGGSGPDAYTKAAAAMVRPAGELLDRPVGVLPSSPMTLKALIELLEDATRVRIAYPFGKHDKWFLDPAVKVTVGKDWNNLKLGEVLEKIGAAHGYPKLEWASIERVDEAIFASGEVKATPIRAGATGLIGGRALVQDPILGMASVREQPTDRSDSILAVVATAKPFQNPSQPHTSLVDVGGDFRQPMFVFGQSTGRLFWRLLAAQPAHAAEEMTPAIRAQVVGDLKRVEAFRKARTQADALKQKLTAGGALAKLAEADKLKMVNTKPFARVQPGDGELMPSYLPEVGRDEEFIKQAFKLGPANPDGPYNDQPAAVIELPRELKVFVAQRVGYQPATVQAFDIIGPYRVMPMLGSQRFRQTTLAWFSPENIEKRTGFTPTHPSEKPQRALPEPSLPDAEY